MPRKIKYDLLDDEKLSGEKCPRCDGRLVKTKFFNPKIYKDDASNPDIVICRNRNCKGWYCEYCEEWHPYGTACSVAAIRNSRSHTDYPTCYEEWIAREKTKMQNALMVHMEKIHFKGKPLTQCPICNMKLNDIMLGAKK